MQACLRDRRKGVRSPQRYNISPYGKSPAGSHAGPPSLWRTSGKAARTTREPASAPGRRPQAVTIPSPPAHRAEQCATLAHGLLPLGGGIGVVDDAGACLHVQAAVLDHRGTDRDGGVGVAPPADPADRAGVDVALVRFEFLDDLQRADL